MKMIKLCVVVMRICGGGVCVCGECWVLVVWEGWEGGVLKRKG